MSQESYDQWFVLRGKVAEGPFTLGDFFDLPLAGRLLPNDQIRAPGESAWQAAGSIQGLFNKLVLRNAAASLKKSDMKSLQDAFLDLSQIINDPQGCSDRRVWWTRGRCQQLMGEHSDDLNNAITYFQAAHKDFCQAVKCDPQDYAALMWKGSAKRWFPENPIYLPAYDAFLDRTTFKWGDELPISFAANALGAMGREATAVLPVLESALPQAGMFRLQVEAAIQRIHHPSKAEKSDELQTLFDHVEHELQVYPVVQNRGQDRFDLESPLTNDDLTLTESQLADLLDDKNWAVRAKAACILRCNSNNLSAETVHALLTHLGPSEKRGNVRGQCAMTLTHFASNGAIKDEILDHLITALLERLEKDAAYPVQGIAAKCLARIASNLPDVITSIASVLATPKNVNLQRDLVAALGEFGPQSEAAFPLVLQFTPHRGDPVGGIIKASTILKIVAPDHPETSKAFQTILVNLRNQPIGNQRSFHEYAERLHWMPLRESQWMNCFVRSCFWSECSLTTLQISAAKLHEP